MTDISNQMTFFYIFASIPWSFTNMYLYMDMQLTMDLYLYMDLYLNIRGMPVKSYKMVFCLLVLVLRVKCHFLGWKGPIQ